MKVKIAKTYGFKNRLLLFYMIVSLFALGNGVAGFFLLGMSLTGAILLVVGIAAVAAAFFIAIFSAKNIDKKIFWLESLLDAIPFPISVTDIDMNWTFINKPVETMLGIKRNEVLGQKCENWNAHICRTENCGIARLRKGMPQTFFEQLGMDFQVDTSYILDKQGNKIGHIEVVQEISSKVRGAAFSKKEVQKLSDNLKKLAEGSLNLEFSVGEGDKYTEEERRNFEEINGNLKLAVNAISRYVKELTNFMVKLAKGDLTQEIESEYLGDFSALKESGNIIINNLNDLFGEIVTAAEQVASGTQQISDGSQKMSQGATEQASSVEELTTSVTQIAAQTKQNATNAGTANELSLSAKNEATKGNEKMKDMQTAMAEINESSENISKIIKVIDDIAFQTNILALNAAVEAARAGIHGKGFAVVAEEVRNLAAKSANAAKETTALIEGSIKKVAAGTSIADETAAALGSIVEGVEKAVELVGQIAMASNEQATGIAQVDDGLSQVSQVVQANSAIAEQSAAASEELSSQAEILKSMIGQFKLKNKLDNDKAWQKKADNNGQIQPDTKQKAASRIGAEFGKY